MNCVALKEGDKCDVCGKGTMRRKGHLCEEKDKRGRISQQSEEILCETCNHQHVNVNLFEYMESPSLGIKVREPGQKKPLLETEVKDRHEYRFSRKPNGALQIARDSGEFTHIHCKVCDNSWKRKESSSYDLSFEVTKDDRGIYMIKCRKCGRIYFSG